MEKLAGSDVSDLVKSVDDYKRAIIRSDVRDAEITRVDGEVRTEGGTRCGEARCRETG